MDLIPLDLAAKIAAASFIPKLAKTRLVKEWQKATATGNQGFADEIAAASGKLNLPGRYLKDISGGGSEAGVDLMMGRAPGGGGDESGYIARKLYKPDSALHRGPYTEQVLREKQDFTDAARNLSPEAKSMVPAMHGYKTHGPAGNQRFSSYHEYIPQMKEMRGGEGLSAAMSARNKVIRPMAEKGMHIGDVVSTHSTSRGGQTINVDNVGAMFDQFKSTGGLYNPGNLVSTPKGPKIVDFLPRKEGDMGGVTKSYLNYGDMGSGSHFVDKSQLGSLRKEVFRPSAAMSPGHLSNQGNMLQAVVTPRAATPAQPTAATAPAGKAALPSAVTAPTAVAKPAPVAPPKPAGVVAPKPISGPAFSNFSKLPSAVTPKPAVAAGAVTKAVGTLAKPMKSLGLGRLSSAFHL